MIARIAVLALSVALAGCASGGGRDGRGPPLRPSANPGAVVAAELALARAVREQADYKAYLAAAAPDAVTFTPGPMLAKDALRGRIARDNIASWAASHVWSSCDGSLAATMGGWTKPSGEAGSFMTVWQRDDRGAYKWVLDQTVPLAEPLAEQDMVQAEVADCGSGQRLSLDKPEALSIPGQGGGVSRDGTLAFEWTIDGDRSLRLMLRMIKDGAPREQISLVVPPPGGGL